MTRRPGGNVRPYQARKAGVRKYRQAFQNLSFRVKQQAVDQQQGTLSKMCGFFASLGPQGSAPTPVQCRQALDLLANRGPDGEGLYRGKCSGTEFVFGHRRLAIVGLNDRPQPLVSGDHVLLVNGEFYNYKAIRADLQAKGIHFESQGDTEIALRLYQYYRGDNDKDGGPSRWVTPLTGEWALVLWDGKTRTLWAACDPFGTRPLRYWVSPDSAQLKLASEAKALFAIGVPAKLDEEALRLHLEFQFLPWGRTLFSGIKMLPPGSWLKWQSGAVETGMLWNHGDMTPTRGLSSIVEVANFFRFSDVESDAVSSALSDGSPRLAKVRALRCAMNAAVKRRIPEETAYCAHISGGVDSASVAALVSAVSKASLEAFTASFPWAQSGDETELATSSAKLMGLKLHSVGMEPRCLLAAMDESAYRAEGLAMNFHAAAKLLLADATRERGYKVVFTGEGADEAFYGYEFFRADFHERERPMTADVNIATLGIQRPDSNDCGDLTELRELLGGIPAWVLAKAVSGATLSRCLGPRLANVPINRASLLTDLPDITRNGIMRVSFVERARALWTIYGLSAYILRNLEDPNGMSRGIESRFVFLDLAVQWLAARISPLSHYGLDGIEKGLMREALSDLVPEPVLRRPKRPFFVPSFFDIEIAREWARERLLHGNLVSSGLFSEETLVSMLNQPGTPGRDARICTLASLAAFMDRFGLR